MLVLGPLPNSEMREAYVEGFVLKADISWTMPSIEVTNEKDAVFDAIL